MKIEEWFHHQWMTASAYNAERMRQRFLGEMEAGLRGDASSLALLSGLLNFVIALIDNGFGRQVVTG